MWLKLCTVELGPSTTHIGAVYEVRHPGLRVAPGWHADANGLCLQQQGSKPSKNLSGLQARWLRLCLNATTVCAHAAVLAVGAAIYQSQANGDDDAGTSQVKRQQLSRKNAVLVFGATGRTGKLIVKALLDAGRTVIAASRSSQAANKAWNELGVKEGKQEQSGGTLFTETGVDITNTKTLKKEVFAGATQVVVAVGPVRNQDSKPGYAEQMSSERVDGEGVSNIAEVAATKLPRASLVVDPLMQMSDFEDWVQKNDTVMGGNSSSEVTCQDGGAHSH